MPIICQFFLLCLLPLLTTRSSDFFSTGISVASFRRPIQHPVLDPSNLFEREDDFEHKVLSSQQQPEDSDGDSDPFLESLYQSLNLDDGQQLKNLRPNPVDNTLRFDEQLPLKDFKPSSYVHFDPNEVEILHSDQQEAQHQEEASHENERNVDKQILKTLEDILGTLHEKQSKSSSDKPPVNDKTPGKVAEKPLPKQTASKFLKKQDSEAESIDFGADFLDKKLNRNDDKLLRRPNIPAATSNLDDDLMDSILNEVDEKDKEAEEEPILMENLYKKNKLNTDDHPDLLMKYLADEDDETASRLRNHRQQQQPRFQQEDDTFKYLLPDVFDQSFKPRTREVLWKTPSPLDRLLKLQREEQQLGQKYNGHQDLIRDEVSDDSDTSIVDDDNQANFLTYGSISPEKEIEQGVGSPHESERIIPWADDLENPFPSKEEPKNKEKSAVEQQVEPKVEPKAEPKGEVLLKGLLDGVTGSVDSFPSSHLTSSSLSKDESYSKRTDVKKPGPRFPIVSTFSFLTVSCLV